MQEKLLFKMNFSIYICQTTMDLGSYYIMNVNIFVIGSEIELYIKGFNFIFIDSYKDIKKENIGIIIVNQQNEKQDKTLYEIHKTEKFWAWKIYVVRQTIKSHFFSDGVFDKQQIEKEWANHNIKHNSIKNNNVNKLILWLWLDNKRTIKPYKDNEKSSIFTYPIIDAYHGEEKNHYNYLEYLSEQEIIKKGELINRIRGCNKCNSSYLNYIETCPSCESFNIEETSSLHCFNCGHVNDKNVFFKNNIIECPNCYTQLKHIGVDYDKPIENYKCNSCEHKFSESETRVLCLTCEHQNDVNDLNVHNIYEYNSGNELTDLVKFGNQSNIPELNIEGKVPFKYFINMIEWINKIAIRHNQEHLILTLKIKQTDNNIKESEIISVVSSITNRLNNFLRNTDICCQPKPEIIMLFLPFTNHNSLSTIESKISCLEELIENEAFELIITTNNLPDKINTMEELFQHNLKEQ
jgi:hypothetical protein